MIPGKLQKEVETQILNSYESLYRLAYTYVKNPDDAMDVVQESVYKAISCSAEIRNKATIKSWLCRIVINTALDLLRRHKRETLTEELPELPWEDSYHDEELLRALDVLDQRERTVVVLRFFQEKKLQEIAEIMDENLSTVKTILYRSLKKLRIELSEGESYCERESSGRVEARV